MSIELTTPQDVQQQLASRLEARRLSKNLTQEGLANRSGVSWSSLKRFESTGLIALESLLKISLVLDVTLSEPSMIRYKSIVKGAGSYFVKAFRKTGPGNEGVISAEGTYAIFMRYLYALARIGLSFDAKAAVQFVP